MQFHRPSPYLRRVKLPRLHFAVPTKNIYVPPPYESDDDLPSPDELCARVEFIHLKNAQLRLKSRANDKQQQIVEQQRTALPTPQQQQQQNTFLCPSAAVLGYIGQQHSAVYNKNSGNNN
uniref:Uncharacterized protein n=1 Tax=Globodera pallida TaxID=36090 RepID=A0A183BQE6_GLOPA